MSRTLGVALALVGVLSCSSAARDEPCSDQTVQEALDLIAAASTDFLPSEEISTDDAESHGLPRVVRTGFGASLFLFEKAEALGCAKETEVYFMRGLYYLEHDCALARWNLQKHRDLYPELPKVDDLIRAVDEGKCETWRPDPDQQK